VLASRHDAGVLDHSICFCGPIQLCTAAVSPHHSAGPAADTPEVASPASEGAQREDSFAGAQRAGPGASRGSLFGPWPPPPQQLDFSVDDGAPMPGGEDAGPAAGAAPTAGSRGGDPAAHSAAGDGSAQRPGSPAASELSGAHSGDSSSSGEEEGGAADHRPGKLGTVRCDLRPAACWAPTSGCPTQAAIIWPRMLQLGLISQCGVAQQIVYTSFMRWPAGINVHLHAHHAGRRHGRVGVRAGQHRGRCRGLRHLHGRRRGGAYGLLCSRVRTANPKALGACAVQCWDRCRPRPCFLCCGQPVLMSTRGSQRSLMPSVTRFLTRLSWHDAGVSRGLRARPVREVRIPAVRARRPGAALLPLLPLHHRGLRDCVGERGRGAGSGARGGRRRGPGAGSGSSQALLCGVRLRLNTVIEWFSDFHASAAGVARFFDDLSCAVRLTGPAPVLLRFWCWLELTSAIGRSHEICQTCFCLPTHGLLTFCVTHNTDHNVSGLYDLLDRISSSTCIGCCRSTVYRVCCSLAISAKLRKPTKG
jgi:hypothetical protein